MGQGGRQSGVSQGAREESWGTLEAKGDVHWVQGGSRDTLGVFQGVKGDILMVL